MKWFFYWLRHRRFIHRVTHGKCTDCGIYPPLGGATVCRVCFERMLRKAR